MRLWGTATRGAHAGAVEHRRNTLALGIGAAVALLAWLAWPRAEESPVLLSDPLVAATDRAPALDARTPRAPEKSAPHRQPGVAPGVQDASSETRASSASALPSIEVAGVLTAEGGVEVLGIPVYLIDARAPSARSAREQSEHRDARASSAEDDGAQELAPLVATCDAAGRFRWNVPRPGAWTLAVGSSRAPWVPRQSLDLAPGLLQLEPIALPPLGTVDVTVREGGRSAAAIRVRIEDGGGGLWSTATDGFGHLSVCLPAGTYRFYATDDTLGRGNKAVDVVAGERFALAIELRRAP